MQSFWASNAMKEEEAEELGGGSPEDGLLQDHLAHWVEVLDRWVRRVDLGLGARPAGKDAPGDGGTDPAHGVE